jgi:hypothetical protein
MWCVLILLVIIVIIWGNALAQLDEALHYMLKGAGSIPVEVTEIFH